MDFNKFDSVSAADKGAECHLKHPATLKPLYDNPKDPTEDNGKPCIALVLGAESPTVRAASRAIEKARAKGKPKSTDEEELVSLDEIHADMVEVLAPRITGFKNIHKGKKAATNEDADWFLNLNRMNAQKDEKSFVEQVAEFTSSRAGYLGNVSAV